MNKYQIISAAKEQIRPYVDRISVRAEAMRTNDIELWKYSMSLQFDAAKHIEHNKAIMAVIKLNNAMKEINESPVFTGDISNRQEVGRFCCQFLGMEHNVQFVD